MEQLNVNGILTNLLGKASAASFRGIDPYDFASSKLPVPGVLMPKIFGIIPRTNLRVAGVA